ncbi:unnamed protein product [Meganyctiphanes norvegica]|uniref:Uncharacterized protein n=1 Tax=Meganyctiphanes norvegica TaxID=48144 RepID=A0AAV2PYQ4_MEGNR
MEAERFLLKWNNHQSNLVTVFDQLYEQEAFTDVTLACDGRTFAAHKVILSACSPYFQNLFISNPNTHPIVFMRDVRARDLESLLSFMYRGEINVHQHDLASFLKTAESLQIKGLSDSSERHKETSKILEAMEKKFCSQMAQRSPLTSSQLPIVAPSTPLSSPAHMNSTALTPSALSLHGVVSSSESHTPPSKKFKTTLDDLPRILPKMKSLSGVPPGLVTPVPGLLTPITLAASVMKTAAQAAQQAAMQNSPPTPESTNSTPTSEPHTPNKERYRKEGYISGDSPHPVYLISSVGGYSAQQAHSETNSGNSTPSHEVKVEMEDLDDAGSYSDDGHHPAQGEMGEDGNMACFPEDVLGAARDKLTYPCRYCGKRFTQTGTCRRHERLHTSPNSFKCPFCNKGFNRKYRLKEHITASHPQHAESTDLSLIINTAVSAGIKFEGTI